jgi:hypothetical protein
MGQQQLLFIVLGLILVAIALAVGISLFRENSIDQKRNMLVNDCINLAAMAQQYYLKPTTYGGGGYSFTDWKIPGELQATEIGSFEITSQSATQLIILATGTEVVTGSDSVKVQVTVPAPPSLYQVTPIN